jgi:hypothetical protein
MSSLTSHRHKIRCELQQLMVVVLLLLLLLLMRLLLLKRLVHRQAALVRRRLSLVRQQAAVRQGLQNQGSHYIESTNGTVLLVCTVEKYCSVPGAKTNNNDKIFGL